MAGASEWTEDRSQDKLERTMKIVIINGQSHTGTTCHIARQLAEKIGGDVTEFFLPRDFHDYCVGCMQCILKDEKRCPHYETLRPITEAMDAADVIILASPVYVYHVTGAMKTFLDHYGYRWLIHRPVESMFGKQAVSISTSAAAGEKSACRDMADSLFFWGVGKTYRLGMHVFAHNWGTQLGGRLRETQTGNRSEDHPDRGEDSEPKGTCQTVSENEALLLLCTSASEERYLGGG